MPCSLQLRRLCARVCVLHVKIPKQLGAPQPRICMVRAAAAARILYTISPPPKRSTTQPASRYQQPNLYIYLYLLQMCIIVTIIHKRSRLRSVDAVVRAMPSLLASSPFRYLRRALHSNSRPSAQPAPTNSIYTSMFFTHSFPLVSLSSSIHLPAASSGPISPMS